MENATLELTLVPLVVVRSNIQVSEQGISLIVTFCVSEITKREDIVCL